MSHDFMNLATNQVDGSDETKFDGTRSSFLGTYDSTPKQKFVDSGFADLKDPDGAAYTYNTFCTKGVNSTVQLRNTLLKKLNEILPAPPSNNANIQALQNKINARYLASKEFDNFDMNEFVITGKQFTDDALNPVSANELNINTNLLERKAGANPGTDTWDTQDKVDKAKANFNTAKSENRQKLSELQLKLHQEKQKNNCFKTEWCKEDSALQNLRDRYVYIINCQYKQNPNCNMSMPQCLQNFEKDRQIGYFQSKIEVLRNLSFNFLHRVCDNVVQGCGQEKLTGSDQTTIPDELIDCSGINKPTGIFFGDRDLAAIGRQIAPPNQRNGNSPAARGFAPSLYPVGTLARGSDGLYVNACTPSRDACNPGPSKICIRWIRANLMEVAAYKTAQELRQRITQRKRQIISYAKEVIRLQAKMYQLHPMQAVYKQRRVRDPMCVPVANASQVVDLGLKRLKANMINRHCQDEINEVRQTLRDQSSLMCRPQRRRSSKKKKKNNNKTKKKK